MFRLNGEMSVHSTLANSVIKPKDSLPVLYISSSVSPSFQYNTPNLKFVVINFSSKAVMSLERALCIDLGTCDMAAASKEGCDSLIIIEDGYQTGSRYRVRVMLYDIP